MSSRANSRQTVVLRADGSPSIGMGHFVRTLSLASMLPREEFRCVLATCSPSDTMRADVAAVCEELWELDPTTHFDDFFARLRPEYTVVLDNYFFTTQYQRRIVELGCRLVCVDDMREKHYASHVVINHAIGLTRSDFSLEPYTELCTGLDWAMLRPEFTAAPLRVAVCFGGVDKYDLAGRVRDALPDCDVHMIRSMSAAQVAAEYRAADVAVVSASTTMLEALSVGVPVVAGYYVDNQEDIYHRAYASGLVGGVGDWLAQGAMERLRAQIAHIAASRPGRGAARRYSELFARRVTVRRVDASDCRLIFEWANDPTTRAVSFNTEPIAWPTHCMWFDRKLTDANCFFYIAYAATQPIGQVRVDFDPGGRSSVLGISLAPEARGRGLGGELLGACVRRFFDQCTGCDIINAYVKEDNEPSMRMFLRCGFSQIACRDGVLHFTFKRQ